MKRIRTPQEKVTHRIRTQQARERDRRKAREIYRAWRLKHKDRLNVKARQKRKEQGPPGHEQTEHRRQHDREKNKAYYRANKERLNAGRVKRRKLEWEADPARFRVQARKRTSTRRARKLLAFIEHVDPKVVFKRDKGRCGICRTRVYRQMPWHIDHIIPLAKGGTHCYDNVQLAHEKCNLRKHAALPAGQPTLWQVKAS